jgi:hypothetical protein
MREMIILFRVGFPPDNAISNGLQGESITNRNPYPTHHGDPLRFVGFKCNASFTSS